jgi:anthranilate 1,2-dioxygenase large subunit/terephthalate 1,2-dioxygenase oxygenase component alpha subunit
MVEPTPASRTWPAEGLTRVPYWVYQDEDIYRREQQTIFRGPTWNFIGLEAELPNPGDYKATHIGDMPVVVVRDEQGELRAFENRCAHRGALICIKDRGNAQRFTCVYHNWTYDLQGNLTSVAFRHGIAGKGGMAPEAQPETLAPRKLRITTYHGLVFATLAESTPSIEEYVGAEIAGRIRRVMKEPVKVLGGYSQIFPNNWKLYLDNARDTYHASLLHSFFTKFRLNRLSQKGGVLVSPDGGSHVSFTMMRTDTGGDEYEREGMRSASGGYRLEAPALLETVDEIGDGISLQILGVFPGFVLQQIMNCLAVRQIIPRGVNETELVWTCFGYAVDSEAMTERRLKQANMVGPAGYISMEDGAATAFVQRGVRAASDHAAIVEMGGRGVGSGESRISETSVRGVWQAYRRHMGL